MTKVTCSACGEKCEVPFKPATSKPLFCDDCYAKQNKGGSKNNNRKNNNNNNSSRDLDVINEKLNKIMKALKIED